LEFSGIAFDMSNASPIALFFVLFTSKISSKEFDAQRKAINEPTLPEPIIEIR
jgi:hypothetical protein